MLTHALVGLDARRVEVEAHVELGQPGFTIVGLADRACQEAKHRVRSGIASAELFWPARRITVNLAPAGLRKEGSGFDLPIALAVLGFRSSLWLVVAALGVHGVFDLVHGSFVSNPGVPPWWPAFCLTYDVTAAGYLAWLMIRRRGRAWAT